MINVLNGVMKPLYQWHYNLCVLMTEMLLNCQILSGQDKPNVAIARSNENQLVLIAFQLEKVFEKCQ